VKNRKPKKEVKIAPLTPRQKMMMMSVLIRSPEAFTAAQLRLTGADFSEYDRGYAITWEAVREYYNNFRALPSYDWLAPEIEARIERDPEGLTEQQLESLNSFLIVSFELTLDDSDSKVARRYLSTFLKERLLDKVRMQLASSDDTPENLSEVFSRLAEKATHIETLRGSPVKSPFSGNWRPKPIKKMPTQVPFFDEFLLGGDAPGEVYGLMGPYGSCKTTLAIQLSILRASYCYNKWQEELKTDPDAKIAMTYYFFYEDEMANYNMRALSAFGEVDIETMRNGDELSTDDDLKPYERELFSAQLSAGAKVLGERSRILMGERMLDTNWRIVDMTGNDPDHPHRGVGLVPEIRDIIQADLESNPGCTVGGIYIDYVGAAARKHAGTVDGGYDSLRHYIGDFPLNASNMLAGRYKCPVYLLHQLSGAQNSKKSGVVPDHTDSAEAKNFGENCHFCFQIGKPDLDNRAVFNCSKARRAPPQPETIIQIEGRYSRVKSTEGKYYLDHASRRITAASEKRKMVTPDALKKRNTVPRNSDVGRWQ